MAVKVKALNQILESGLFDDGDWEHAGTGDLGQVVGSNGDFLLVTWDRTGTTCDCHPSELETMN